MANFYNPYMKTPDFAQGGSDLFNQLMMMMLMKKMMGPQAQTTETPSTEPQGLPPAMGNIQPRPGMAQGIMGGAPQGMPPTGGPGGSPMPQLPPQLLMMLMQMMQQRR